MQDFVEYTPSRDTIPEKTWRGRHRNIVLSVLVHVPALLSLGLSEWTARSFDRIGVEFGDGVAVGPQRNSGCDEDGRLDPATLVVGVGVTVLVATAVSLWAYRHAVAELDAYSVE